MITGFRIKNLRSIIDTSEIPIRKLNIIVGRNSSGKSTVLRTLPLLRQSVEQKTRGPILWFGRLVDFGSFEDAARDGDTKRGVELGFSVTFSAARPLHRYSPLRRARSDTPFIVSPRGPVAAEVTIQIGYDKQSNSSFVQRVCLKFSDDIVEINYKSLSKVDSIFISGEKVAELESDEQWLIQSGGFIPILTLAREIVIEDGGSGDEIESYIEEVADPFLPRVVSAMANLVHGNTSPFTLESIARRLRYHNAKRFLTALSLQQGAPPSLSRSVSLANAESPGMTHLRRAVLLSKLPDILEAVDQELVTFSQSVVYMEPIRAAAERYYRNQDLAVNEIDSRGGNVAMFLASISSFERESLNKWMKEHFDVELFVHSTGGHTEIKIRDRRGVSRNIADLGFGYSQVIPIVLQAWKLRRSSSPIRNRVFAIEQPELHLHPDFQSRMADMLVSMQGKASNFSPSFFIETHSDHFVNRVGSLVSNGKLDSKDVQVIVVDDGDQAENVSVKIAEFDSEGFLGKNWPSGFFTPGAYTA